MHSHEAALEMLIVRICLDFEENIRDQRKGFTTDKLHHLAQEHQIHNSVCGGVWDSAEMIHVLVD